MAIQALGASAGAVLTPLGNLVSGGDRRSVTTDGLPIRTRVNSRVESRGHIDFTLWSTQIFRSKFLARRIGRRNSWANDLVIHNFCVLTFSLNKNHDHSY